MALKNDLSLQEINEQSDLELDIDAEIELLHPNKSIKTKGIFILILFYGCIVFSHFLKMHFVHDTYTISIGGYGIMVNPLWEQGRPISSLFYYILALLNPPYWLTMYISVILSIAFLAVSAAVIWKIAVEYIEKHNIWHHLFLIISCTSIFFTLFITDLLLFFECSITTLGIMCSALAVYCFLKNDKKSIVLSGFLLIISIFTYQPSIALFIPLCVTFVFKKYEGDIGTIFKKILIVGFLYSIPFLITYIYLKANGSTDGRFFGEVSLWENLVHCQEAVAEFFKNNFGFMPNYIFSAFLVYFVLICIINCIRTKTFMNLVCLFIPLAGIIVTALLPHMVIVTNTWYIVPRSAVGLTSIVGIAMLAMSMSFKRIKKHHVIISLLFLLIISTKLLDIGSTMITNNKLDAHELGFISDVIQTYEEQNNITVNTIYFTYDSNPDFHRQGMKAYKDLNLRILSVDWMVRTLINDEMGRNYSRNNMSDEERNAFFGNTDWHSMSLEQFVFVDDALYLCLY